MDHTQTLVLIQELKRLQEQARTIIDADENGSVAELADARELSAVMPDLAGSSPAGTTDSTSL